MEVRELERLEFDRLRARVAELADTPMGRRIVEVLLPTSDAGEAVRRLAETEEALVCLPKVPSLSGVADIHPWVVRAGKGGVLPPEAFLALRAHLRAAERLRRTLAEVSRERPLPNLLAYAERLASLPALVEEIEWVFDERGEVLDRASDDLLEIRRRLRELDARVREILQDYVRSPEFRQHLQEPVIAFRAGRPVLPVKSGSAPVFGGRIVDVSQSGYTIFVEPESVVALGDRRQALVAEEAREIERILRRLSRKVGARAHELLASHEALGALDAIFARARYAAELRATRPALRPRGRIVLRGARHPFLPPASAVANDIVFPEGVRALLLTGPNTGGKTVTLKTVGLLAAMAQSGLFVPAREAELPVFDGIYADIGDEQSLEQSLSTFSAHMGHIVEILRRATEDSLVLLDEIGTGTDPAEGAALAQAILDALLARGAHVVATTHYGELKAYALSRPGIVNASVSFDLETLRPTYELRIGIPGESHALTIARRLGLEEGILAAAERYLRTGRELLGERIAELERARAAQERAREEAEATRAQYAAELEALRREREDFRRERERILTEGRAQAEEHVRRARSEARAILRELRALRDELVRLASHAQKTRGGEGGVPELRASELLRAAEAAYRRLAHEEEALPQAFAGGQKEDPARGEARAAEREEGEDRSPRPGDRVYLPRYNLQAEVVQVTPRELVVRAGSLRIGVPPDEVVSLRTNGGPSSVPGRKERASRREQGAEPAGGHFLRADAAVTPELDLRGMTVEEALHTLEHYLDRALLAGYSRVRVIHGLGTGALRRAVRERLRELPYVRAFRAGGEGEGGEGATVVELVP
ncbi:MAG: Smr/MutS family protein [Brockia lithotrophica]|nr:Smr/MutS family protein [Brockia lithotrophica]